MGSVNLRHLKRAYERKPWVAQMLRVCGLTAFVEVVIRRFQTSSFRSMVDGERISKENDAVRCLGNTVTRMLGVGGLITFADILI